MGEHMSDLPSTGRQLRTEVTSAGELKLNLVDVPTAAPKPEQVVVRVEASPINPSDLGLQLGMADVTTPSRWAAMTTRQSVLKFLRVFCRI